MINLLEELSVTQIITYVCLIAVATRGVFDYIAWLKDKNKKKFEEKYQEKQRNELIDKYEEINNNMQNHMADCYSSLEDKIDNLADGINFRMDSMEDQLKVLTDSDMHDIKGWIVEKHHIFMKQGWIDDFTMDTIEKRYSDYKKEGGNSYVHKLVEDLRALPNTAPEE